MTLSVITGGPGVGKTGLIEELHRRGYQTVPEDARGIIKNQLATGGQGLPWKDKTLYAQLMLKASLSSYDAVLTGGRSEPVFFDRGILDTICYMEMEHIPVSSDLRKKVGDRPYDKTVFLLPPWEEIYRMDRERKQSWAEAQRTYTHMKHTYLRFGYHIVEIPKAGVCERVDFLLNYRKAEP